MSLYTLIQIFTTPESTLGKYCEYWTNLQMNTFALSTKIPRLNMFFIHLFQQPTQGEGTVLLTLFEYCKCFGIVNISNMSIYLIPAKIN